MSIYQEFSPYLFKFDAERVHSFTEWTLKNVVSLPLVQDYVVSQHCVFDESLYTEVAGMRFYNPVGLAAGFDKNATMIKGLSALGFGFLEIGTITQAPQTGNPKPRLFRYVQEKSLQNEMGFNNQGSFKVASRLKKIYPYSIPIGINVGKNKIIAPKDSLKNYENVLLDCLEVGDYFVFNLSSPNTPNLRDLQNAKFVQELFLMARSHTQKPLFIKISPDMNKAEMLKVVEASIKYGSNGVIATNTTTDYSVLNGAKQSGGVSGSALKQKSKEVLKILSEAFFGQTTFISVGGIDNAEEAYERIKLGASLVQVFSGLVFQGPKLCREINEGLLQLLRADGFNVLSEAIGYDILNKSKKGARAIKASKTDAPKVDSAQKQGKEAQSKEISQEIAPKKRGRKPKNATNIENTQQSKNAIKSTKESKTTETKNKIKNTKKRKSPQKAISNEGEVAPKKRGRKSKQELLALSASKLEESNKSLLEIHTESGVASANASYTNNSQNPTSQTTTDNDIKVQDNQNITQIDRVDSQKE